MTCNDSDVADAAAADDEDGDDVSGFVVEYISHPVINSFTTASAITIAEAQLKVVSQTAERIRRETVEA